RAPGTHCRVATEAGQGSGLRGLRAGRPDTRPDTRARGDRLTMLDLTALSDFGLGWLEASGPNSDIVLSTRVRLARNLQGLSFTSRCRPAERAQVYERLSEAVESGNSLTGGVALDLTNLNRLS